MSESLFQPCITVRDNLAVDVDWGDSYVNTVSEDGTERYDDPESHCSLMDLILGEKESTGASQLRRLADYLDGTLTIDT